MGITAYSASNCPAPRFHTGYESQWAVCGGGCVHLYTRKFLSDMLARSATEEGDWRESPLCCIVTPFWDRARSPGVVRSTDQNRMGAESWGRGQIVNGAFLPQSCSVAKCRPSDRAFWVRIVKPDKSYEIGKSGDVKLLPYLAVETPCDGS